MSNCILLQKSHTNVVRVEAALRRQFDRCSAVRNAAVQEINQGSSTASQVNVLITCVTIARNEPCSDALDLVGTGFASWKDWTLYWLYCNKFKTCLQWLEELQIERWGEREWNRGVCCNKEGMMHGGNICDSMGSSYDSILGDTVTSFHSRRGIGRKETERKQDVLRHDIPDQIRSACHPFRLHR